MIDFREREQEGGRDRMREREREREIDLLFHLLMHSLVDSGTRPDQGLNPAPWRVGTVL